MPRRVPSGCRVPGCPVLAASRGYCERHAAEHERQYEQTRGSAASRGYDAQWRRLRKMHLAKYPLCSDWFGVHAKENRLVEGTEVDHIIPKRQGGTDDGSNLQTLCHACHSRKTILESNISEG